MTRRAALFCCLALAPVTGAPAAGEVTSEKAVFRVEELAAGLRNPWAIEKLPDGRFLVTERVGALRVIENDRLLEEPVAGTPEVWARGQGGLLDVALHPDFSRNGWIYLAYSERRDDTAMTRIVRGRLDGGKWVDEQVIFEAGPGEYSGGHVHFGCRMDFDNEGHLFFSIGDRGGPTRPGNPAQSLDNSRGKILRLHDDGRVPADNPFAGRPGVHPAIWSYGNRNAQGLRFDRQTGILWSTEHGPRGGDELNIIRRGANYGWPLVTFGSNYSGTPITDRTEADGMESPVLDWTPSIAVSGVEIYRGDRFPGWSGNLFAPALARQKLVRMELDEANRVTRQEALLERTGRLRDVRAFDDGFLYLVYDEPGRVVRLVPR